MAQEEQYKVLGYNSPDPSDDSAQRYKVLDYHEEYSPIEDESIPKKIARWGVYGAERAASGLVDLPGHALGMLGGTFNLGVGTGLKAQELAAKAQSFLGDEVNEPIEESQKPYLPTDKIPQLSDYTTKLLFKKLSPTGWLEPQTDLQKNVGNAAGEIAAVAAMGAAKGMKTFLGYAGSILGGNLIKWGVDEAGFHPAFGSGAKMAGVMALQLMPRAFNSFKTYLKTGFDSIDRRAKPLSIPMHAIEPKLRGLEHWSKEGLKYGEQKYIKETVDKIRDDLSKPGHSAYRPVGKSQKGFSFEKKPPAPPGTDVAIPFKESEIPFHEKILRGLKPSKSTQLKERADPGFQRVYEGVPGPDRSSLRGIKRPVDAFETKQGPVLTGSEALAMSRRLKAELYDGNVPKKAERVFTSLIGKMEQNIGKSFQRSDPALAEDYKNYKEMYSTYKTESHVRKFMEENINPKKLGYLAAMYLMNKASLGTLTSAVSVGITSREIVRIADIFMHSPNAKKYAHNIIRAAMANNKAVLIKEVDNLDKAFNKRSKERK